MNEKGIYLEGYLFKEDGTTLGWTEFMSKMESVGLEYTGKSVWVDTNGDLQEGIETSLEDPPKEEIKVKTEFDTLTEKINYITKGNHMEKYKQGIPVKSEIGLYMDELRKGNVIQLSNFLSRPEYTEKSKELASYIREHIGNYNGFRGEYEGSSRNMEEVIYNLNNYLEEQGNDLYIEETVISGTEEYLVRITDNLYLMVMVIDEYDGGGDYTNYLDVSNILVNDKTSEQDVDVLLEVLNKYV